jgi:hypothetical protein
MPVPKFQEPSTAAASASAANTNQFQASSVLFFVGALLVIAAAADFLHVIQSAYGVFMLSGVLGATIAYGGHYMWTVRDYRIVGGLLVTIAVCFTPVCIFSLQLATNLWQQDRLNTFAWVLGRSHPYAKAAFLPMLLVTIAVSAVAFHFIHFPFITAPAAVSVYYASFELASLLADVSLFTELHSAYVMCLVGCIILVTTYCVSKRQPKYADSVFWFYLFGTWGLSWGLAWIMWTSHKGASHEAAHLIYCVFNCILIWIAVCLQQKVFLVAGALGILHYMAHLWFKYARSQFITAIFGLAGVVTMLIGHLVHTRENK